MSWRNEFGKDWTVPQVIDAHPELVDISWHNDASPSFAPRGLQAHEQDDIIMRLWVQHPDPTQREYEGNGGRFLVYSQIGCDDEVHAYEGDNADAAIAALLQVYATWRAANPLKKTRTKAAREKAQRAAEDAASDELQRQHAAQHPDGCGSCEACVARVRYGLTVGTMIVLTHAHPWSGKGQRGMEKVTSRCRIARVRPNGFDYVAVQVIDVVDPLPGGPYDGDAWRTRELTDHKGGMTWSYAFEQFGHTLMVDIKDGKD